MLESRQLYLMPVPLARRAARRPSCIPWLRPPVTFPLPRGSRSAHPARGGICRSGRGPGPRWCHGVAAAAWCLADRGWPSLLGDGLELGRVKAQAMMRGAVAVEEVGGHGRRERRRRWEGAGEGGGRRAERQAKGAAAAER
ncbi:hypothetical protein SEVIR_4G066550v4 [Setaria viridis]